MRERRLPRVFWLFVAATILQAAAFYLLAVITDLNSRGIVFLAILVVLLARRSRIAWSLLVVIDGIPTLIMLLSVLFGTSSGGGSVLWSHVVVALITGIALVALLLSRPMRDFVERRDSAVVAL